MSNLPDGFGSKPCDTEDPRSPWSDDYEEEQLELDLEDEEDD